MMMKSQFFAIVGLAALATAASLGCAETVDVPDDAEESSEDALTNRQLPGVAAVEIAEVRAQTTVLSAKTLGAPKKVKSLVTVIKKLRANEPQPRCLERDTTRLTYLDAAGKKLATVSTHCGGFGSISFENGSPGYAVKYNTASVDTTKNAPFAVGDALWGITKIELSRPGRNDTRTLTGGRVAVVLAGFDLDEVPDANASFPRCLPSHAVTLMRGEKNVAFTSFICGSTDPANAPASVKASFTAVDPAAGDDAPNLARGGIKLDPRPVIQAFAINR
jgi:hypothetical protein